MSVLLRAASPAPADEITPTVPALAEITAFINARTWPLTALPLVVDAKLYDEAEKEMGRLMKGRGFKNIARAQMPEANFLFHGFPIIRGDE